MLSKKSVMVTGGTGSFGKAFVRTALARYPDIGRVVVFSRDELKQFEMAQVFPPPEPPGLPYVPGHLSDEGRPPPGATVRSGSHPPACFNTAAFGSFAWPSSGGSAIQGVRPPHPQPTSRERRNLRELTAAPISL